MRLDLTCILPDHTEASLPRGKCSSPRAREPLGLQPDLAAPPSAPLPVPGAHGCCTRLGREGRRRRKSKEGWIPILKTVCVWWRNCHSSHVLPEGAQLAAEAGELGANSWLGLLLALWPLSGCLTSVGLSVLF